MGEISAVQVVGAVIFAVIGGFAWWLQERMPSEHAALFSWIVLLVFSAASVEVASSPFAWELITRAADITVHSTYSTSYMAILRDVLVFLYVVLRIWRREEGRQAVLKHWDNAKNAFEGLVILFAATFLYHLAITVPQEIGKEANNVPQPSFERNSSNPPRIAYVKTPILHVPKIRDEVVLHPYDLSDSRRETKFLALLKPGESEHDILRIGCTHWSESSCVAGGKFLLLFSKAGWTIDSDRVFRVEPLIPIEGMAMVSNGEPPKQPPHLGTWEKMDASKTKIWKAFTEMGIPVSSSTQVDLPAGTLGIYFGPEPGPQTIQLPLLLIHCVPVGESCDVVAGRTETHGSFITNGNARQLIHVTRPKRVSFQPDMSEKKFSVDESELPKHLILGRCGGQACRLTVLKFTKVGVVVDSRGATVTKDDGKMHGVLINWTVIASHDATAGH